MYQVAHACWHPHCRHRMDTQHAGPSCQCAVLSWVLNVLRWDVSLEATLRSVIDLTAWGLNSALFTLLYKPNDPSRHGSTLPTCSRVAARLPALAMRCPCFSKHLVRYFSLFAQGSHGSSGANGRTTFQHSDHHQRQQSLRVRLTTGIRLSA